MASVGKGIKLSELLEKLKHYADVEEVDVDPVVGITTIVFTTDEIASAPNDGLYVSAYEFKIKKSIIYSFSVESADKDKIKVYLFLKNDAVINDLTRNNER